MQEMSQKLTFFSSFVKKFFPDLTLPQLRFLQIRLGQIRCLLKDDFAQITVCFVYKVTKPLQECMTEMPKQTKFYETALADRNN